MNIRPLESLTKEELIELVKQERGDHNGDDKTSDSVLNAKYTDGYISGYVVACNFAASLASEAWVNHVFHTGLDGLIERCKNMQQVLLEKAQACRAQGHGHVLFYPLAMIPEGWKLVPVEPTEAMNIAARDWSIGKYGKAIGTDASEGCYKAMLAATPTIKDCLTAQPTDSEMLDWIENNARIDPDMSGNHTYWPTSFGKQIRGRNLRDAITKAMRGEE